MSAPSTQTPGLHYTAVIDIGKTNAKVVVVDTVNVVECETLSTPNTALDRPPYPQADVAALEGFIIRSLGELSQRWTITAITVTTHGATAALIDANGQLALPVLDYEHTGPESASDEYEACRPPFSDTGSPRLPVGLNLGAQLFWQFREFPEKAARAVTLLTYPQYWVFRLCGVRSNEVTSLGCHTDLWLPGAGVHSSLVDDQGWSQLFPPLQLPGEEANTLTADIARRTGLSTAVTIHTGIHDSNASLVEHLLDRQAPFSVVSTGTWVICMAIGGDDVELDEKRDTLLNVNAFGEAVPSSRFMGGRERQLLLEAFGDIPESSGTGGCTDDYGENGSGTDDAGPDGEPEIISALAEVLERQIMLLPSTVKGSGPCPDHASRWSVEPGTLSPTVRTVVIELYLALMCCECLRMIGACGPTIIEGPFNGNGIFRAALAAITQREVEFSRESSTGTATGAARLVALHAHDRCNRRDLLDAAVQPAVSGQHRNSELINSRSPHWPGVDANLMDDYARRWRNLTATGNR